MAIDFVGEAVQKAKKTLESHISDLEAKLVDQKQMYEQQIISYKASLTREQIYGNIGRAAMSALRDRSGTPFGITPQTGTDIIITKYVKMGMDFDTLMNAVKKDIMLTSEWERFCMMLRLAEGGDSNEEE